MTKLKDAINNTLNDLHHCKDEDKENLVLMAQNLVSQLYEQIKYSEYLIVRRQHNIFSVFNNLVNNLEVKNES